MIRGLAAASALLLLPATTLSEGTELCVVSRHSGELIAGDDFAVDASSGARRAQDLAETVRVEAEAGNGARRAGPDFQLDVDDDRVVVRGPKATAPARARAESAVEVQVFGLVGPDRVSVLCRGRAARVSGRQVEELPPGWQTLRAALGTGAILCTRGAWQVRVAGSQPRPYAGVFSFRPLPDRPPEAGSTRRETRARRGSEVIFRTTRSAYVSGVMAAEHAGLAGEAGLALAQVIAHDAHVERHRGGRSATPPTARSSWGPRRRPRR